MKKEISKILTFDEFKRLAERKPNLEGKWIYKLTRSVMCEITENMYPKFDIWEDLTIWFITFKEAEDKIAELVAEKEADSPDLTYCYEILQFPIGVPCEHGAGWLYDHKGCLVDYSITSWTGEEDDIRFYGRPANRKRFKKGEIVEVFESKRVYLSLLVHDSPSIEHCWKIYNRCVNDKEEPMPYFLDASDDCCYLIDGPGHEYHAHVSPLAIMKPRFPIPKDIESEMKGWLEIMENQKYEPEDSVEQKSIGEKMGDFYQLSFHIQLANDGKPHIHISDGYGMEVALRIDAPEYYPHEGSFTDKLSDGQIEAMMEWLEDVECCRTKWWYLLREWNDWYDDEPEKQIPLTTPLPDYRLLKQSDV